jgi:hypothetical protein
LARRRPSGQIRGDSESVLHAVAQALQLNDVDRLDASVDLGRAEAEGAPLMLSCTEARTAGLAYGRLGAAVVAAVVRARSTDASRRSCRSSCTTTTVQQGLLGLDD